MLTKMASFAVHTYFLVSMYKHNVAWLVLLRVRVLYIHCALESVFYKNTI